jgi:hypothetical protein
MRRREVGKSRDDGALVGAQPRSEDRKEVLRPEPKRRIWLARAGSANENAPVGTGALSVLTGRRDMCFLSMGGRSGPSDDACRTEPR